MSFTGYALIVLLSQATVSANLSQNITTYPPVNETNTTTPLYFGLIVSSGEATNASSNVAGIQLGLDRINSHPSLLKNYTLHFVLSDSKCDRTVALGGLFEQVAVQPNILALIGAGCSTATELTAEVSHFFGISQNGINFLKDIKDYENVFGYQAFTPYCFDAIWMLAFALSRTLTDVMLDNSSGTDAAPNGETCLYSSLNQPNKQSVLDVLFRELSNTSFDGVSGGVAFDENGIREATRLPVYQFRYSTVNRSERLSWFRFGEFVKNEQVNNYTFIYDDNENVESVWEDGIPHDGIIISTFFQPITIVFCIVTSIGIIFAFVCLIFNILYRKKKVVRLTSPNLNYFIIGGAWLFYVDIYFFVIPTDGAAGVRFSCNITTWFSVVAYTLCFGTIIAKMCRVWIIFRKPSPNRRMAINDWVLAVGVLALLALDLVILTIYTIFEQTLGGEVAKLIPNKEVLGEDGKAATNNFVYICDSSVQQIVVGFLYAFKLILQVVALALAFMTRKVKVKGLDDAKYIAVIIYITSIVIAIIAVCEFSLSEYVNAYAVVFSTGILLAATCVLALVFIPTVIKTLVYSV